MRKRSLSLNGEWLFTVADGKKYNVSDYVCGGAGIYENTVNVPFSPGTPLSGIERSGVSLWYKREFDLNAEDASGTVELHFAAASFRTEVYVNGTLCIVHKGVCSPFFADISRFVKNGANVLCVNTLNDNKDQNSLFDSGIWGDVSLEFAKKAHIAALRLTPDFQGARIIAEGVLSDALEGGILRATLTYNGEKVNTYRYNAEKRFTLSVPLKNKPELWELLNGKLYYVEITLTDRDGREADSAISYCAFRTFDILDGKFRVNGKPLFLRCIGDRGYYSGGGYTAPDTAAIKQDLLHAVSLGFNAIKMTVKPASAEMRYLADLAGMILIEKYPSVGMDYTDKTAVNQMSREWGEMVISRYGNPSVMFWEPIDKECNNTELLQEIYAFTKRLDPSRLIVGHSSALSDVIEKPFKTENSGKKRRNDPVVSSNLPAFLTCDGIDFEKEREQEFLSQYEKFTNAATEKNVIGYIYTGLCDARDSHNGLFDTARNNKLSRAGVAEFTRLNAKKPYSV